MPRKEDISTLHHPKNDILSFFKFLQKIVSRLDKRANEHFCIISRVVSCKNHVGRPLHSFNKCRKFLLSSLESFFCRNLKMSECHFWADVMLRQPRIWASRASPAQKSQGLRIAYYKNFSRPTFFVFWVT